ncbi:hypothetical protein G210_2715 [Candida maltosa Xu316]|uniref:Uncharacterized protein n=1 Tax=Candida maltosa (strain Xu316) TaxID=1245528 RepID=M3JX72_CANMX|nr:hypothetical protein G210_2715 [Candida maltosa Xu316]
MTIRAVQSSVNCSRQFVCGIIIVIQINYPFYVFVCIDDCVRHGLRNKLVRVS